MPKEKKKNMSMDTWITPPKPPPTPVVETPKKPPTPVVETPKKPHRDMNYAEEQCRQFVGDRQRCDESDPSGEICPLRGCCGIRDKRYYL